MDIVQFQKSPTLTSNEEKLTKFSEETISEDENNQNSQSQSLNTITTNNDNTCNKNEKDSKIIKKNNNNIFSSYSECTESSENDINSLNQNQQQIQQQYPFMLFKEMIDTRRYIKQQPKIIVDLSFTKYDIVKHVCEDLFIYDVQYNHNVKSNFNLQWIDTYLQIEDYKRMLSFQKINHFPGSQQLGKKNLLSANLFKMRNSFPQNYNFYPLTWILPQQYEQLKRFHYQSLKQKPYYIVKPEACSQGKGIFLTNTIDQLQNKEHFVIQEYIKKPFLIDGLKFDLRLYVLIKNINPLKIFLFQEGLARFATILYQEPNKNNQNNLNIHLTNYSLNKKHPKFIQNQSIQHDDIGHKRSFSSVLKHLQEQGHNVELLMMEIRQIIVKSIISAQPHISNLQKTYQQRNDGNEMCFEIFGFDIMIDENLQPFLLEVNHTPSFSTDSPLDFIIKRNLIIDTLNLINTSNKQKQKYIQLILFNKQIIYIKKKILQRKSIIINTQKIFYQKKILLFERRYR
ncbi:tubulin-tyrosine ligase family protein, putative [Ichthyophthirius multifiliis]|uniref:Tubulin-tyrosine ligase family protein, putative n=1 Tax=Ichthyophthirius multifiliis TaxID=5932 RepID=G0R5N3_ICHMU|nr:tubulin-tyrosine ligase family protein, putative [Ichthyophthirius multifiliis]EGR27206.1 tubulin-tyrosine ligase family protein, putative [Ichthyophthirius multifiliis]|eukprot:XP_004024090.1 tubulin-tyrosine ligase family protein, putative [Ichthyophthirius multifiliis]